MEIFMPVKDLLIRSWDFFANFLAAIVVFVLGWIVAKVIKTVVTKVLKGLRLDSIAEQAKISNFLSKGGIKYTLSELVGLIIYWVILLGVIISSMNLLKLTGVSNLLDKILGYTPNVIGAVVILVVGMFVAIFVASIVRTAAANIGLNQANLLSKIVEAIIVIFSILVALEELQIGAVLISAMSIILASMGLAVALAFGLGCKEIAGRSISDFVDKLKKK
ncbi:MAG: hypothetical protein KKH29_01265 [Candidatus Omnitrophica bacterium]|nr:hypothetical protein [Candidatus Omnitrophota bacterium]MBU4345940.1 hypothetical protein [Candidatus Omnitrophota bacterium]MBU4472686.1 hypothetical protein [Candidatus Omnitrophota bacterium]MCG2705967.1 hypothetical protein [Candidatus Omnitrophota bacterium]